MDNDNVYGLASEGVTRSDTAISQPNTDDSFEFDSDTYSESNSDSNTETKVKRIYGESSSDSDSSSSQISESEACTSSMRTLRVDDGERSLTLSRSQERVLFSRRGVRASQSRGQYFQIPEQETSKKYTAIYNADRTEGFLRLHGARSRNTFQEYVPIKANGFPEEVNKNKKAMISKLRKKNDAENLIPNDMGQLGNIRRGCIQFEFECSNEQEKQTLLSRFKSGELAEILKRTIDSSEMRETFGTKEISFHLERPEMIESVSYAYCEVLNEWFWSPDTKKWIQCKYEKVMDGAMKDAVPSSRHLKIIRQLRERRPVPPENSGDCPICDIARQYQSQEQRTKSKKSYKRNNRYSSVETARSSSRSSIPQGKSEMGVQAGEQTGNDHMTVVLLRRIDELQKVVETANEKVSSLERKLETVQRKTNNNEQYSRSLNLRINGLPETYNENCVDSVVQLAKDMGIHLAVNDINRAFRMGPRKYRPRPILVQFLRYKDRQLFFTRRTQLKGSDIFIREDLTKENHALLHRARETFPWAWSSQGKIMVRNQQSPVQLYRIGLSSA